jgi:hypothetical protein
MSKEERIKQEQEKIKRQLLNSLPDITEDNAEELAKEMVDRMIKMGESKKNKLKVYKHIGFAICLGLILSFIFMYFK